MRHSWDLTPEEAVALQERLAGLVRLEPLGAPPRTVGGVDMAGDPHGRRLRAAAVVLSFPGLELLETAETTVDVPFPYLRGLLTFREAPAILAVLELLRELPDVLLIDGQGLAHPRRLGIASHVGLLLDRPTIGCAKRRLVGTHEALSDRKGAAADLVHRGEVVGAVLRTRAGAKPVFVSPGHQTDLGSARAIVLACCPRYRIPEPLRLAHSLAGRRA